MAGISGGNKKKGFTLVELMVAVAILGIMVAVAVPNLIRYRDNYSFRNDASQMEYLVKYGKVYAMEHSVNVGICVEPAARRMTLRNLGYDRDADPCDDGIIIRTIVMEDHVTLSSATEKMKFDARGVMIFPGFGSNVCVSYGDRSFKIILNPVGMRVEEGDSC